MSQLSQPKGTGAAKHTRAKEIFVEVMDLSAKERESYLEEACGGDAELFEEVETLLAHHSPVSVIETTPGRQTAEDREIMASVARGQNGATGVGRIFLSRRARLMWTLVAAAILLALGFWVHSRIERALLTIRANELTTVLDAEVQAVDLWISDQQAQIEHLAKDPQIRPLVEDLLEIHERENGDTAIEALMQAPARLALMKIADRYTETIPTSLAIAILNDRGVMVFIDVPAETGFTLNAIGFVYLGRALAGQTVFMPPHRYRDITDQTDEGSMYTIVFTPLRGAGERVIAVLASGMRAYGPGSSS